MTTITGVPGTMRRSRLFLLAILALFGALLWFPATGSAEEGSQAANGQKQQSPEALEPKTTAPETFELKPKTQEAAEQAPKLSEVAELKQQAQQAYIGGRYTEAVAANLKIARRFPGSKERRYAVQMLGTLYEDNLVDIKNALKWDREFLKKYADPRQVSFYKDKMASLEKMLGQEQEQAFKTYQGIRFANAGDETMVKRFEALLKEHPDFLMKVAVERELGYAYLRMDKRKESYQAFQAVSRDAGKKVTTSDRIQLDTSGRYWEMTSTWGKVAWGVVVLLWVWVLLMKPWERVTRSTIRTFLIWAAIWTVLTALRMPTFYAISTDADMIILHDSAVYLAAGLNLTVLLWIMLLTKGKFWQNRPGALRWLSPVLSLVMTAAVFFLFMIYQPNGPETTDVFAVKYDYLRGELLERLHL